MEYLVRRSRDGKLWSWETSSLVGILLRYPYPEIERSACRVVEQARAAGGVTDEEWQKFWLLHTNTRFVIRARVRRSKAIPLCLTTNDLKWNLGSNGDRRWLASLQSIDINGVVWAPPGGIPFVKGARHWPRDDDRQLILPPEILGKLHDGIQTVTAVVEAHDSLNQVHKKLGAQFEFVADSAPTIDFTKANAALRQLVDRSLSVSLFRPFYASHDVQLGFMCRKPPVNFYSKVYVASGGREWAMAGNFMLTKGEGMSGGGGAATLDLPIPSKADLIFRPDPESAMLTSDFNEIWGEEIVFKDVPIK